MHRLTVSRRRKPQSVTIAVIGSTGVGKTSFINLVSGSQMRVGTGSAPCTDKVRCAKPFRLDDYVVRLIDTPGLDDTTRSNADVLWMITDFLSAEYRRGNSLHGVIYLHPISDNRVGGVAMRNFKFFQRLCGDEALANSVIVTNMWGEITYSVGMARESELRSKDVFFKPALEAGAQMVRHDSTAQCARDVLRLLVTKCPQPLLIQREMVKERRQLSETVVGQALLSELTEREHRHQQHLHELETELEKAFRHMNLNDLRELQKARQILILEREEVYAARRRILEGLGWRLAAESSSVVNHCQGHSLSFSAVGKLLTWARDLLSIVHVRAVGQG